MAFAISKKNFTDINMGNKTKRQNPAEFEDYITTTSEAECQVEDVY